MKKGTKNVVKIIVSLLYIIWGITAPISAFTALLSLDIGAIIGAAVGVLMLLAGIFALIGIKSAKCKILGIVIFIFAALGFVYSLMGGYLDWRNLISAVLAWLFIICL